MVLENYDGVKVGVRLILLNDQGISVDRDRSKRPSRPSRLPRDRSCMNMCLKNTFNQLNPLLYLLPVN